MHIAYPLHVFSTISKANKHPGNKNWLQAILDGAYILSCNQRIACTQSKPAILGIPL
jgi:hypothetical protein